MGVNASVRPFDVALGGRDLTRIGDLVAAEAEAILDLAAELKRDPEPLAPRKTLGLYFTKHSTRTRASLAVAMTQLGGASLSLQAEEMQLSRGESLDDTARVLSGYLDAIAIRTGPQAEVDAWADAASVPVINALTDEEHPCQALADALTIRERLGGTDGARIAWVGDGSNVCASLARLAPMLGMEMVVAAPAGYEPAVDGVDVARDAREAAAGADVLVTDTWISMGQEDERETRLRDLEPYRLTRELVALASPEAIVLHCLPAHPGEEIEADVLYGPRSAVWDEAENRLHTQKALLALLLG
jgi:ornithine carbamoyltransferase